MTTHGHRLRCLVAVYQAAGNRVARNSLRRGARGGTARSAHAQYVFFQHRDNTA